MVVMIWRKRKAKTCVLIMTMMIKVRKGRRQIIGHICTRFLLQEKKRANDRRAGFTSFRALFAPLRTMFCLKKCFHFWTENIECVRRIFSFCLLRDSCFVVFLENLAITCIRSYIYVMIALLLACYRSYGKTIFYFHLA